MTTCPASGKLPINTMEYVTNGGDTNSAHDGWPHGRILCSECGNTYEPTSKELARKHKVIHVATVSEWARAGLVKLIAEHPKLQLPKFYQH